MRVKSSRTVYFSLALGLLLVFAYVPGLAHAHAYTPSTGTGLLIPLYSYPGSDAWVQILQEKQAYPSVPVTVIINPGNGYVSYDSNYAYWISELKSVGITVIGYVPTWYGSVSLSTAEYEASQYASIYGVNGIFVDEMSNIPGWEWYYSELTSYAHSDGLSLVVGNPGTSVPSSFVGTVDVLVIFENSYLPSQGWMQSSTFGDNPNGFGMMAYNSWLDSGTLSMLAQYASYLYLTNLGWPNPYVDVPSYFATLMADLSSYSSSPSPSSSSSPAPSSGSPVPTFTINVWTDTTSYQTIYGMYTLIYYNGNLVDTGFSPLAYTGPAGSYTVCVDNYSYLSFNNWQDGTTNSCYALSLSSNVQLVAYYNT